MAKYKVTLCREYWGTIEVDADSESEAMNKISDGDYETEFVPGKIGNESIYTALEVKETASTEVEIICYSCNGDGWTVPYGPNGYEAQEKCETCDGKKKLLVNEEFAAKINETK